MDQPKISIPPRRSMLLYALLAILMTAVSYLLLLFIAVACVYLPYLGMGHSSGTGQMTVLFLFGIVLAGAIAWSLIPRWERFKPPAGPLLLREQEPLLFAELDLVAASLGQKVPENVYLIDAMNAYVADAGGMLGFGSRRIMALGLPLLSVLNVSEFRAILAHEFAHFYGGDTRLGPWVYKARKALVESFDNLKSLNPYVRFAILQLAYVVVLRVLRWYFEAFLRITSHISRRQEYRADELASLVIGPVALIGGLKQLHAAGPAWFSYWYVEVLSLVAEGALPGVADGFARYVAAPAMRQEIESVLANELKDKKVTPYDTHPPLGHRIATMEKLQLATREDDPRPAISLLADCAAAELALTQHCCAFPPSFPSLRVSAGTMSPINAHCRNGARAYKSTRRLSTGSPLERSPIR